MINVGKCIMNFNEQMIEKGWTRQKHTLVIKGKEEYRYHKDGSELTEKEAEEIFDLGFDACEQTRGL